MTGLSPLLQTGTMKGVKELVARRRECLERFSEWERTHPCFPSPADAIADLGALLQWIPKDLRSSDPDPDRDGIRTLHRLLSVLGPRL